MKINDDDLKKIYKSYVLTRTPLSRQACPSSEQILKIFMDSGIKTEKERIVDHISNCSSCVQEFDAFLEIARHEEKLTREIEELLRDEAGPFFIVKKNSQKIIKRFSPVWRFALASVILVSLVGVFFLVIKGPIFNRMSEKRGIKAGQIRLLEPRLDRASQPPLVFRWDEIEGRDFYVVELFDESLSPLWKSAKIFDTSLRLPSYIEKQLNKGGSYFWMVTVFFTNGLVRESHLEEFKIAD